MKSWTFRLSPIAASRPRVAKYGTYFTGPYKIWRGEIVSVIQEALGKSFKPMSKPLFVVLELYVRRPKTTKLQFPRADVDNFEKAVYDSLNGKLWVDDTQIVAATPIKEWAEPGEEGYFIVTVKELTRIGLFLKKLKKVIKEL